MIKIDNETKEIIIWLIKTILESFSIGLFIGSYLYVFYEVEAHFDLKSFGLVFVTVSCYELCNYIRKVKI